MIRWNPRGDELSVLLWREMIARSAIQRIKRCRNSLVFESERWLARLPHSFEPPTIGTQGLKMLTCETKHGTFSKRSTPVRKVLATGEPDSERSCRTAPVSHYPAPEEYEAELRRLDTWKRWAIPIAVGLGGCTVMALAFAVWRALA